MTLPITIPDSICRFSEFYEKRSKCVPNELKTVRSEKPDLSDIHEPLPSKKSEYTCSVTVNGVRWLGATTGLTRYEPDAAYECDRVLYFSADRDIPDNNVKALWADGDIIWVLTETGAAKITTKMLSAKEKADMLLKETQEIVDRRGMVSQRHLGVPRQPESKLPYNSSDNDGTFTAGYALGELFRYAVLKREKGTDDEETVLARKSATRAVEACLLLMYIPGRGDGFVARTYLTPHEPVPDDGLFYRKQGGKAVCLRTTCSIRKGLAGTEVEAGTPVPERLARLYKDEGYSDDGIVYKGDTSSDEITHHYLTILYAHEILGADDPELDELMIAAGRKTLDFILDNGLVLKECDGKPTTWAKWNREYFSTMIGWSDGCLNSAELLMYLKVMMYVTGEKGHWQEAYDRLAADGYIERTAMHDERFFISAMESGHETVEDMMYGDHMLATCSYWTLVRLEEDPAVKEIFRKGYRAWNDTFRREHNPGYDYPFMIACPDDEIDTQMHINWFRRFHVTRLATAVSLDTRHDVPKRIRFGGSEETACLLYPDEIAITKYDRNPFNWCSCEGGAGCVESCYVYTFAYWLGRYAGFITE